MPSRSCSSRTCCRTQHHGWRTHKHKPLETKKLYSFSHITTSMATMTTQTETKTEMEMKWSTQQSRLQRLQNSHSGSLHLSPSLKLNRCHYHRGREESASLVASDEPTLSAASSPRSLHSQHHRRQHPQKLTQRKNSRETQSLHLIKSRRHTI